ncbi:BMP family ABC transporter substrate-binding protein [Alteribacillus bidgolensis]|uniref:Nucleoside-binding protein n=1 Tax=Alteribacillus bidgolensis TaxID=930129 RepID=A0A1G8J4J9_9BACI|nr:BMP family ABC transporter substrate-binding protein [Alteribacillus bidgolensis]SDI26169.1 nucleoside-binding protein [Alteribacillus bidgolensis]
MFLNRKYIGLFIVGYTVLLLLSACSTDMSTASSDNKAALLLESTIDDEGWNSKGYHGLLNIQSELDMEVMYEENVSSLGAVKTSLDTLKEEGVDLVFGHGKIFAEMFDELSEDYADMHFVSFNGEVSNENVTSIHFDGYAMGYFAGRLSGAMSDTNTVGVISAQKWQPEAEGFVEGVQTKDASVEVINNNIESWDDKEKALQTLNDMLAEDADIIYPAGDGFHIEVINKLKEEGLYAIGYVGDQSDLGESTVLTSTVQHVDEMYRMAAEQYQNNELDSGNITVDFQEGAITMGEYSPRVPENVQKQLDEEIEEYKQTGELPTE